jgi:S-adenosyl-L-methionine methyltransferase
MLAHPACVPPPDRFFLGDVLGTLPRAIARLGPNSALANLDIGAGDDRATRELVHDMMPLLLQLLKPGAVVVSGGPLEHESLLALPLPLGIKPDRHFLYARVHASVAALVALHPANSNRHQERRAALAPQR